MYVQPLLQIENKRRCDEQCWRCSFVFFFKVELFLRIFFTFTFIFSLSKLLFFYNNAEFRDFSLGLKFHSKYDFRYFSIQLQLADSRKIIFRGELSGIPYSEEKSENLT